MLHMKILVVCQYFYPENFSINDVVATFVKHGHDVLVVTGQPNYGYNRIMEGYENVRDEVLFGARVHRCPLKPRKKGRLSVILNYLSFWSSSKRYLSHLKENFDVVFSTVLSPLTAIVGGSIYAKKHRVRHILHCLDLWPESTVVTGAVKDKSPMYRILFHWCKGIYRHLDEILISSPSFVSYFHDVLGITNIPITYVSQPAPIAKPSTEITYDHAYNPVYAGNIGTLQLVEQLVLAIEKIKDEVDICLHLIGMGSRSEAVRELIQTRHLEECVRFYGIKPRDVTAAYYQKATGIIVSLTHAGTVGSTIPAKLTTALYYGVPILGVIEHDGRKVLESSGGAILAESENVDDIASAMKCLTAKSEEERLALGKKNRSYFDAHYQLENIVSQIEDHLKN